MANEKFGVKNKKNILFWKIFPFIITACLITPILFYETEDPTYWFIFLPAVILCVFPFSMAVSHNVRAYIIRRRLNISPELAHENPQLKDLGAKAAKWAPITMLTWIVVFLVIAAIAISSKKLKQRESGQEIVRYSQPRALSEGSSKHANLCKFDITIRCLFLIPFVGLVSFAIFLIRSLIKKRATWRKETNLFWKILPIASGATFIVPILLVFILGGLMQKIVRNEAKNFLNTVSSAASVRINGQLIEDPNIIITELSKLAPLSAHHSHPTERVRIEIIDGDEGLTVDLGRDSDRAQEYWVFYLGYGHTRVNEIGRIVTNIFDDY